jgi:hypothetical protein
VPAPATNFVDFGVVQIHDSTSKKISVANAGKFSFEYSWVPENASPALTLLGGKMNGSLAKGTTTDFTLTFTPLAETVIDGSAYTLQVAGKYEYRIHPRGIGAQPALRFSFMRYDFGPCFLTSPGGTTVVEEVRLCVLIPPGSACC